MKTFRQVLAGICLSLSLATAACVSVEPFEYKSEREVKQGPGLLTGEEGAWIIYP